MSSVIPFNEHAGGSSTADSENAAAISARRFQFEIRKDSEGRQVLFFHRIAMSDIHWGSGQSRAKRTYDCLFKTATNELDLIGDIVDGERLRAKSAWNFPLYHRQGAGSILRKADEGVKVRYYKGNHEDGINRTIHGEDGTSHAYRRLDGKTIYGVDFVTDRGFTDAKGRRHYRVHGDRFDTFMGLSEEEMTRWYRIGNTALDIAFGIDGLLHKIPGLEHTSIAAWCKRQVKQTIENRLGVRAEIEKFLDGSDHDCFTYGHTHMPGFEWTKGGKLRINTGCCTEHVNLLVEDASGTFAILTWHKDGIDVLEEPASVGAPPLSYYLKWEDLGLDESFQRAAPVHEDISTARADRLLRLAYRQWTPLDRSDLAKSIRTRSDLLKTFEAAAGENPDFMSAYTREFLQQNAELEKLRASLRNMGVPVPKPSRQEMGLAPQKTSAPVPKLQIVA